MTSPTAISELLSQLCSVLHSEEFRDRHRRSAKDFVRDRILTLPVLVMFFLRLRGGVSLQGALDAFFAPGEEAASFLRTVTKSALCQARQKFKASAFAELNGLWVSGWHQAHTSYKRWCGLRVVAADGVCFRVPKWRENLQTFGWGPNADGSVLMTRCLALFSVATKQFLHIEIGNYSQGERALLVNSLEHLHASDLLVMDRGYPAWWLFALLQQRSRHFCARLDNCSWPLLKQFVGLGVDDWVAPARPLAARSRAQLKALGLQDVPEAVRLRFVRVRQSGGKTMLLVTSLTDQGAYPLQAFEHLYSQRWGIEESFKTLKHHLDIEGFTGELPQSIEQEIQAKALLYNITQALCALAQERVVQKKLNGRSTTPLPCSASACCCATGSATASVPWAP